MEITRSSGVLLHPSSLPGPFGIGDFGSQAYEWVDFLAEGGFSWWQILPIGPTGFGHSPYQSFSSFAGNPLLISPQLLFEEGLLNQVEIENHDPFPSNFVNYSAVTSFKESLLQKAACKLQTKPDLVRGFDEFRIHESEWLDDYALFMALKDKFGDLAWTEWPVEIKNRQAEAIKQAQVELAECIQFHSAVQYLFTKQWNALSEYARKNKIGFIGDLPIYVAHDSVDVWLDRHLFQLDDSGNLTSLAGVPPDYFTETGQLWGNPLYDWPVHAKNDFLWWQKRLGHSLDNFDWVRLDHFRGFAGYWSVPADEKTAENGRWVEGPGKEFFQAMKNSLRKFAIIAEDLGEITPDVIALREAFNLPSMKVMQFAFFDDMEHEFLPHNYPRNSVVYSATHDHDTSLGWFRSAEPQVKEFAMKYLSSGEDELVGKMIEAAMFSAAQLAMFPMQDLLNLDTSGRMNEPGTLEGNWMWRMKAGAASGDLAKKMKAINKLSER